MPREIARYKTAISRTDLSRPIKTALSDGILSPGVGVFDYGCGRGDDLLTSFASERGRLPADDELSNAADICRVFGSIRRAFRVISSGTVKELWAEITRKRREDLIIYLALSRFGGRPSFGRLSRVLQGDVKGLFGNYKSACESADALLYSLGRPGVTELAAQDSKVGKHTPAALYVHESALGAVPPVLRLLEGCAQNFIGKIDNSNIIKLHRGEPKVSYLSYVRTLRFARLDPGMSRSVSEDGMRQPSVIADLGPHLAAEHPVGPRGVHQNHRQQEQRPDQEKRLRAR